MAALQLRGPTVVLTSSWKGRDDEGQLRPVAVQHRCESLFRLSAFIRAASPAFCTTFAHLRDLVQVQISSSTSLCAHATSSKDLHARQKSP